MPPRTQGGNVATVPLRLLSSFKNVGHFILSGALRLNYKYLTTKRTGVTGKPRIFPKLV